MNKISPSEKSKIRRGSRSSQREDRRREILRATIRSIERVGFADTTLATVAEIAGVAQGSLIFHFKTKDDLLVATLRYMADEYRDTWQKALLDAPPDPVQRLCVLVKTEFRPDICTLGKIAVWKAFWAEAKSRPVYQKICGGRDDVRHAAVRHCVTVVLEQDKDRRSAADISTALDVQLDGLAETLLAGPKVMTRADALRVAFLTLRSLLPAHADEILAFQQDNGIQ